MLKNLCCMRLRTAGMVIGWMGLVGSILGTMVFCGLLIYTNVTAGRMQYLVDDESYIRMILSYSVCFGVAVLQVLASGMLLLGTIKDRHLMLLPWLINSSIGMVSMVLTGLGEFYLIFASSKHGVFVVLFMAQLISLAITVLFFITIYSLYKEIRLANDQKAIPLMQTQVPDVSPHQTTTYPNYAQL